MRIPATRRDLEPLLSNWCTADLRARTLQATAATATSCDEKSSKELQYPTQRHIGDARFLFFPVHVVSLVSELCYRYLCKQFTAPFFPEQNRLVYYLSLANFHREIENKTTVMVRSRPRIIKRAPILAPIRTRHGCFSTLNNIRDMYKCTADYRYNICTAIFKRFSCGPCGGGGGSPKNLVLKPHKEYFFK